VAPDIHPLPARKRLHGNAHRANTVKGPMDVLTLPLLAMALIVVATIVYKAIRDHARGTLAD